MPTTRDSRHHVCQDEEALPQTHTLLLAQTRAALRQADSPPTTLTFRPEALGSTYLGTYMNNRKSGRMCIVEEVWQQIALPSI